MRYVTTVLLVLLGSVLGLRQACADGVCERGYHDLTPAESATMTSVLEAARAAVPAPPSGWINTLNDDSVSPPRSVCLDYSPWGYSYSRHYSHVEGAEEREQAVAEAGADLKAAMAEKQPRLDALMAEMNTLSTEFAEAAASGDSARVETIKAESERLNAEYEAVMNEGDPMAAFEAATTSQYQDLEMSVAVRVNPLTESPIDGAQAIEVSGASAAWEWTSGDDGQSGNALVLFGTWRPAASGYGLESVGIPGVAPEQPQAIAVTIIAHKARLPSMIAATDFAALADLLTR